MGLLYRQSLEFAVFSFIMVFNLLAGNENVENQRWTTDVVEHDISTTSLSETSPTFSTQLDLIRTHSDIETTQSTPPLSDSTQRQRHQDLVPTHCDIDTTQGTPSPNRQVAQIPVNSTASLETERGGDALIESRSESNGSNLQENREEPETDEGEDTSFGTDTGFNNVDLKEDYENFDYVELGASLVESNISVVFGGKVYEGCEAGMRCGHVCTPKSQTTVRGLSESQTILDGPAFLADSNLFTCKCDSVCVSFGDCCLDVLLFCFDLFDKDDYAIESFLNNQSKEGIPDDLSSIPMMEALAGQSEDLEMVYNAYLIKLGSCVRVDRDHGVRVISSCPQDFSDIELLEACQNGRSALLPAVSSKIRENFYITFKNAFCAQCHGVHRSKLVAWDSSLICNSSLETLSRQNRNATINLELLEGLVVQGYCWVKFETALDLSVSPHRTCQPGFDITDDLRQSMDYSIAQNFCTPLETLLCLAYIVPLNGFRNPHCKDCTLYKGSSIQRVRRDAADECSKIQDSNASLRPGGVLVLLDITGTYSRSDSGGAAYLCEDHQVFDPLVQTCEELSCAEGAEPYRGVCVLTDGVYVPASTQLFPEEWNKYFVSVSYSLVSTGKLIDCQSFFRGFDTVFGPNEMIAKLGYVTIRSYIDLISENERYISGEMYEEGVYCQEQYELPRDQNSFQEFKFSISPGINDIEVELEEINKIVTSTFEFLWIENATMKISNIDGDFNNLTCPENQFKTELNNMTLYTHKGKRYAAINVTGVQFNFPLRSIGFKKTSHFSVDSAFSFLVCLKTDIFAWRNCSVTTYFRNETKFIKDGTELEVVRSGRQFDKRLVYDIDNQILVCDGSFDIGKLSSNSDDVYLNLSWVCSSISIAFLTIMLIMYWVFPELRTLPGRLIACLAATMLLTFALNLLTLVELHHNILCPIAAVAAHFVTLAHYGWMSAIAVNMALTFGGESVRYQTAEDGGRLFFRYSVVVWGASALIVAVSLGLDLTHSDHQYLSAQSVYEPNVTIAQNSSVPGSSPQILRSDITGNFIQSEMLTSQTPSISTEIPNNNTRDAIQMVNSAPKNLSYTVISEPDQFPRYGYPYCSWFSGPLWTRLAFVLVPYGLTLIIDIVGFTMTIRGILASTRASSKTLSKHMQYRTQCLIFLKLSTTMGISWSISVFFTVSQSRFLVYLYTTLVLLQGLLLFLAFMVNKRVLGLVMKRCSCGSELLYKIKVSTQGGTSSSKETQISQVHSISQ